MIPSLFANGKVKVKVTQSYLTLYNPKDYIVHGILQARILEWVAFPFPRGSSQSRDRTQVSHIAGRFFTSWATRTAHLSSQSEHNCTKLKILDTEIELLLANFSHSPCKYMLSWVNFIINVVNIFNTMVIIQNPKKYDKSICW